MLEGYAMTPTPEALAREVILGCSHGRWIGPNDVFGVCGSCLVAALTEQAREIEHLTRARGDQGMSEPKMQHCFNCEAEIGVYVKFSRKLDTCGERECEQAARDTERREDEEARYQAQKDNFERYR